MVAMETTPLLTNAQEERESKVKGGYDTVGFPVFHLVLIRPVTQHHLRLENTTNILQTVPGAAVRRSHFMGYLV